MNNEILFIYILSHIQNNIIFQLKSLIEYLKHEYFFYKTTSQ